MKRQHYFFAASAAVITWSAIASLTPAVSLAANTTKSTPSAQDVTAGTSDLKQTPDPQPNDTYVIKSGDYLEAIAQDHHVAWPSVYEINTTIQNPDLIYPDQKIEIPRSDVPLTRSLSQAPMEIAQTYAPKPLPATKVTADRLTQQASALGQTNQGDKAPDTATSDGYGWLVGKPYVAGGTTPAGFDCSGLTQYLAAQRGISLPRTALEQYHATRREGLADLQPGDLVIFNQGHVGMYIGGNKVIHATNPAQGVRIDSLSMAIQYNGYMGSGAVGH